MSTGFYKAPSSFSNTLKLGIGNHQKLNCRKIEVILFQLVLKWRCVLPSPLNRNDIKASHNVEKQLRCLHIVYLCWVQKGVYGCLYSVRCSGSEQAMWLHFSPGKHFQRCLSYNLMQRSSPKCHTYIQIMCINSLCWMSIAA